MTPAVACVVALQVPVFVLWAFLMFRSLFRLRRRAVARTGSAVPGVGATLESWRAFVILPEFRTDRRLLGATTLLMFALIGLHAWLVSKGST